MWRDCSCEKFGSLYLAKPGLTAGWQFGRRNLGEARDFQCLLHIEILYFSLCVVKILHYFNNSDALETLFQDKYCYEVVLWSVNFCEAL